MRYLSPVSTAVFAIMLLLSAVEVDAQYVSAYDSKGNPRSTSDRNAEQARNNQTLRYVPPPSSPDPGTSRTPYERRQAEKRLNDSRNFEIDRLAAEKLEREEKKLPDALKYDEYVTWENYSALRRVRRKATGKYGYIDQKGKVIIAMQYDNADSFSEGIAAVMFNGAWGYVNTANKPITFYKYDEADAFNGGVAAVRIKDSWGYIDTRGNEFIPVKYSKKPVFSEGLLNMRLDSKCGYIDRSNNIVVPYIYDAAYSFENGMAMVSLDDKWGYINHTGTIVIPIKYDEIFDFREGIAPVILNKKFGFINSSGQEIVPPVYDNFTGFENDIVKVELKGKVFYFDRSAKRVSSKGVPLPSANARKAGGGRGKLIKKKAAL